MKTKKFGIILFFSLLCFSLVSKLSEMPNFENENNMTKLPSTNEINIYEWIETWGNDSYYVCGNGIVLDGSGNIFITGLIESSNSDPCDVILLKFDSEGNILRNTTWGGLESHEVGEGIAIDDTGNVFITGYMDSYSTDSYDLLLLKYDSQGNLLWNTTWGGLEDEIGREIALDGLGNVFIIGNIEISWGDPKDVILLKYNSEGDLLYNITWGGSDGETGYAIAVDTSGNVYITGQTYSYGAGSGDIYLLKYDFQGSLLWNTTWGGSNNEYGYGIALDDPGNIFITGITASYAVGIFDSFLLKYDMEGNLLWNATWGGSKDDNGEGIVIDNSGNIYITGFTTSFGANNKDVLLLKYDSNGNLLWDTTWGGSNSEYGYAIAVDTSGNVFITGYIYSYETGVHNSFILLKFGIDTDEDELIDEEEINNYGTDPNNSDTDGDGIDDGAEIKLGTNPLNSDTDGDWFSDGEEKNSGTDPLNFMDNWLIRGIYISISIISFVLLYLVIRKIKIKKINTILEKGDNLKAESDLEKSIELYQEAFLKADKSNKFILKSIKSTSKGKLDETLEKKINQFLEKADNLKREGKYMKAIDNLKLTQQFTQQIIDKTIKEEFNTKIITILDQIYVKFIEANIEEALHLREMKKFDESIKTFRNALHKMQEISDEELKNKFHSILTDHTYTTRTEKTKSVILNLSQSYSRLEVSDIIEKCGEGEAVIISAIQDMIKNREISAEYFKSSKAIAFKQEIDVEEIDKLMKSFEDWEKEGTDKKL